jgi:hypothetical protein
VEALEKNVRVFYKKAEHGRPVVDATSLVPEAAADPEEITPRISEPPAGMSRRFLGHQVELWATLGLDLDHAMGLTVNPEDLPAMLRFLQDEYRRASKLLRKKPEVRDCFRWSHVDMWMRLTGVRR